MPPDPPIAWLRAFGTPLSGSVTLSFSFLFSKLNLSVIVLIRWIFYYKGCPVILKILSAQCGNRSNTVFIIISVDHAVIEVFLNL